jgi:hypothetical protein
LAVLTFPLFTYNFTFTGQLSQLHVVGEIHHPLGVRWLD